MKKRTMLIIFSALLIFVGVIFLVEGMYITDQDNTYSKATLPLPISGTNGQ